MTPEDRLKEAVLACFDAWMERKAAESHKVVEEMDKMILGMVDRVTPIMDRRPEPYRSEMLAWAERMRKSCG